MGLDVRDWFQKDALVYGPGYLRSEAGRLHQPTAPADKEEGNGGSYFVPFLEEKQEENTCDYSIYSKSNAMRRWLNI